MDSLGLEQDMRSGLESGLCVLQLTPVSRQGEKPSHGTAGEEGLLPFVLEPKVPHG